jgi:hypothetical protein
MPEVGQAITLKKKTTGELLKGKVARVETIVTLDEPIQINTPWYQDTIKEVKVSEGYEIVPSGGKRRGAKTRKGKGKRKARKGTRRH